MCRLLGWASDRPVTVADGMAFAHKVDAASVVTMDDRGGMPRISQIPERVTAPLRRSA